MEGVISIGLETHRQQGLVVEAVRPSSYKVLN